MDKIDRGVFKNTERIFIGTFRPEFVDFFNSHGLNGALKYDTQVSFWKDRVKHTDAHKDDFSSDAIYERCFEEIPHIIRYPDYISVHPKEKSVSFIKGYTSNHTNVAIRVTVSGDLSYRTMYPIMDAMLTHYIDTSHAWRVEYDESDKAIIIEASSHDEN